MEKQNLNVSQSLIVEDYETENALVVGKTAGLGSCTYQGRTGENS